MRLNIYALAKIAIMTDGLHAGCEWSEGEALRRNVDVRRVNARGCTINVYEVQIVPIGTIRIEVGKVSWGEKSDWSYIHRLRDAGTSSTQDSLPFPLPFPLSSFS
jgi:hypothetical protein